ncbi:hypothetical protein [Arthrobacter sp. MMS24-S77]
MATRYFRSIAAAAAALAVLSGCTAPAAPKSNTSPSITSPSITSPSPTPTAASSVPFTLLTHCGIYEAKVQGSFFVADQPLDDGNGNPPAGWGNPFQQGNMTVEGQRAVFRDDSGHSVTFHERPGATSFLRTCS